MNKAITIAALAAILTGCASGPAAPKTQAELQCDYEARASMNGRFGASPFEAAALYGACMRAKGGVR